MTSRLYLTQTRDGRKTFFGGSAVKCFLRHRSCLLAIGYSLELANERALQYVFN
jgi:hypothetical protein